MKSYIPKTFFKDHEGNQIDSKESIRILVFTFSSALDTSAQVEQIRKGFVSRIWSLRHLSHRDMDKADLLKVYKSILVKTHSTRLSLDG